MPSKQQPELPRLSPAEIEIMKEVWRLGQAGVRDLTEAVNAARSGPPVARTTILKTVQRLEEKGWLLRSTSERPAVYRAAAPEAEAASGLVRTLRDSMFDGSPVSLVRCLLGNSPLKPSELEELQRLIDQGKERA